MYTQLPSSSFRHVLDKPTRMPPFNAPSWKQLALRYAPDAEFAKPATESQLAVLEQSLGIKLPSGLREFLLEADGFTADYGSRVIWSARNIVEQNQLFRTTVAFRELYLPFDHLLFFGDHSGGDLFAFPIQAVGQIHKNDNFVGITKRIRALGLQVIWSSFLRQG